MAFVALQPASSKRARENELKTLRIPKRIEDVADYLDETDVEALKREFPDGKVFIWGVKLERASQWGKMLHNKTLVLFRQGERVVLRGIVTHKVMNEDLALHLWGPDDDGQPWTLVYFIKKLKRVDIAAAEVSRAAGRSLEDNWQAFTVLFPPEADLVVKEFLDALR